MENKKLLKFLYKDIAEIEEVFADKGAEGFDEFEIDFIQSRFKGAKQVIQILSEKENKQLKRTRPRHTVQNTDEVEVLSVDEKGHVHSSPQVTEESGEEKKKEFDSEKGVKNTISVEEKERLEDLSQFEEEVKGSGQSQFEDEEEEIEAPEPSIIENPQPDEIEIPQPIEVEPEKPLEVEQPKSELKVELDEEEQVDKANSRLGDSFSKEKSVNELLAADDSNKLEYKISNSPVSSIQSAIGINDRYQYIRELFDGNSDLFLKAVTELDKMNSIQEAVNYLQQNYKWKKNDTSLKFVTLVKRRFPNG
uniref:hypothetical protein n=1 Tax=uncultured Draconibacterium sp. TaxID=1573823 RepID=UPI0032168120